MQFLTQTILYIAEEEVVVVVAGCMEEEEEEGYMDGWES